MSKAQYIAPFKGQCLCGSVQYEADSIDSNYAHCHCSMCRKFHGAAFSTYGAAQLSAFRWTAGVEHLTSYTANNGSVRQFCKTCGSSLTFATQKNKNIIEFSLATLDRGPALQPDAHLHIDSKVSWLDLSQDNLLKYFGNRD